MSLITFAIADPQASGTDAPSTSYLVAALRNREAVDGTIRTTNSFRIDLIEGRSATPLSDTGPNQCWEIAERGAIAYPQTRYVIVDGDADYTDLVDVDPLTLVPLTVVPPSVADLLSQAEGILESVEGSTEDVAVSLAAIVEHRAAVEAIPISSDNLMALNARTVGGAFQSQLSATFATISDDTDLAFRGLRSALDSGRSCAMHWSGDSTLQDGGVVAGDPCTPTRLASMLGAAYPAYHVRSLQWNDTTGEFDPAVILQSGLAGQRFVSLSGRSIRFIPAAGAGRFASGNMDLRVKVNIAAQANSAALIARVTSATSGWGTQFGFRFYITSAGILRMAISYNGSSWDDIPATAAIPTALYGTDTWLRTTAEVVPGTGAAGSITIKFYTSTDKAVWTQVGSTVSYAGDRTAAWDSTADFEVGAYAWQPSNDGLTGKVYEVEIRDGVSGPLIAPVTPEQWQRYPSTATTYGGSPTLRIINASKAGQNMAYLSASSRLARLTPDYGQSIALFATSHNEVEYSGAAQWSTPYASWVNAVLARIPLAAPVAVIQNPHTSAWANETAYGESHKLRMDELRALAGRNRWGMLDLYRAFILDARGVAGLVSSDGLHPTQTGYAYSAQVAARLAGIVVL